MNCLVFGVGGQDGSYLTKILLDAGYNVVGVYRRSSYDNLARIRDVAGHDRLTLVCGDITDPQSVELVISAAKPTWVFNEADQDDVRHAGACPGYQIDVTVRGVVNILTAVDHLCPRARVFQPLSATMLKPGSDQSINDGFRPRSVYAMAKLAAYEACNYYARERGLWVARVIMYNHDSPRRGPGYLLQTLCDQTCGVLLGRRKYISMYALHQKFSIGHAYDYMTAAVATMDLATGAPDFLLHPGYEWSILEMVEMIRRITDRDIDVKEATPPEVVYDMTTTDRTAFNLLDWEPSYSIEDLLREILREKGALT